MGNSPNSKHRSLSRTQPTDHNYTTSGDTTSATTISQRGTCVSDTSCGLPPSISKAQSHSRSMEAPAASLTRPRGKTSMVPSSSAIESQLASGSSCAATVSSNDRSSAARHASRATVSMSGAAVVSGMLTESVSRVGSGAKSKTTPSPSRTARTINVSLSGRGDTGAPHFGHALA